MNNTSLGIALTAGGAVASAGFSFITVLQVIRQSGNMNEQISLQRQSVHQQLDATREQLQRQDIALSRQQDQLEQASESFLRQFELTRQALEEAIRSRLDSTSPNASIFVRDQHLSAELTDRGRLIPWPDGYLEASEQDVRLTIRIGIRAENYGPSPALLRVIDPDFGKWEDVENGDVRLIGPNKFYDLTWIHIMPVRRWPERLRGGSGSRVSIRASLRIDSLQSTVHDTHILPFWFDLYKQDGSRLMLTAQPIIVSSHGAGAVMRKYNKNIGQDK